MSSTKSLALRGGRVLRADGNLHSADVLLEGRHLSRFVADASADHELNLDGAYVLPGIVNLHVHGLGYESPESDTLHEMARLSARFGNTAFCLTLHGPPDQVMAHMRRHRETTREFADLPSCVGFRLEGPYMLHAGGGTSSAIAAIDPPLTEALQEAGAEHLRIWDISPEIPGALELIAQLSSEGYVTSLAHTRCTIDQASRAVDAGLSLVTHLFDTFEVPSMTDPGVYPAGLVDYLLVEDRVVAEIIPDGTHVPPLLVEKALRCKSPQGLAFVTDSNVGAGLPPGEYKLKWGDGTITLSDENSGARTADGVLAGSALTPLGAFRNAVTLFGRDLATACRLCCETPARLLGLNKGVLEPGRDADVIVLDENLELLYTIVAGEIAYSGV